VLLRSYIMELTTEKGNIKLTAYLLQEVSVGIDVMKGSFQLDRGRDPADSHFCFAIVQCRHVK